MDRVHLQTNTKIAKLLRPRNSLSMVTGRNTSHRGKEIFTNWMPNVGGFGCVQYV